MFDWMYWTTPVAVFFICIGLMLLCMTLWEIVEPSVERKGWLPLYSTRGDRLFIGLILAAYINLAFIGLGDYFVNWFNLDEEPSVWISFILSMFNLILIMRKG